MIQEEMVRGPQASGMVKIPSLSLKSSSKKIAITSLNVSLTQSLLVLRKEIKTSTAKSFLRIDLACLVSSPTNAR